jgi:hypothetical protein
VRNLRSAAVVPSCGFGQRRAPLPLVRECVEDEAAGEDSANDQSNPTCNPSLVHVSRPHICFGQRLRLLNVAAKKSAPLTELAANFRTAAPRHETEIPAQGVATDLKVLWRTAPPISGKLCVRRSRARSCWPRRSRSACPPSAGSGRCFFCLYAMRRRCIAGA